MVREFLNDKWRMLNRVRSYKACFFEDGKLSEDAQVVLKDMRRFGKLDEPSFIISPVTRTADPVASAYQEGMRTMYRRILFNLKVDENELINATMEEVPNDD